jgi:putative phosphoesterase
MLIAVISDIHDNLLNLEKCLAWCRAQKISKMICCGDVCDADTLKFLAQNFPGKIFLVEGNGETFTESDLKGLENIDYRQEIGVEKISGLNLGFCHQSKAIDKVIESSSKALDFIFFGHSHKPWLERRDQIFLANPGNLSGTFYQATFATLDTKNKKLDLKILAHL